VGLHLRNWLGATVLAGSTALVLASCTFPVRFATPEEVQQATAPTPITVGGGALAPPPAPGGLEQIQADLRRLIGLVGPSVVRVDTATASGNGLLIDSSGTLVTPASLVAGSQQVTVTTSSGQKYTGLVAGADATSDVALVRVSGGAGLTPAPFGDSTGVQIGDVVVSIGAGTVSQGIVSQITARVIVTTAPMSSISSGSALVNIAGQVIGMTTLGPLSAPTPGVALPSNQVNAVAQQLLTGRSSPTAPAAKAVLGVSVTDAPGGGATIQSLVAGGPAASAGIQTGWTIVSIGGHPVANAAALGPILATYTPGQRVALTVQLPDGSTRSVQVVLGSG
jgi:putative serine protease PepD